MVFLLIVFIASFFADKHVLFLSEMIKNSSLDYFLSWVSHIGSVFIVMVFMTTLFLWEDKKREYIFPMWLSFISSLVVTCVIKLIVARPRPFVEMVPLINWFFYSFPSTHTAIAFSVVPILDKELPKFKWFWIGFSVLVGVSRIYLHAHYLSDVIAGALIGYALGYGFLIYEQKRKPFKRIFQ